MEFFSQEYWSGLPFPSRGDLPGPGIKPASPALQADSLPSILPGSPLDWFNMNHIESCYQEMGAKRGGHLEERTSI